MTTPAKQVRRAIRGNPITQPQGRKVQELSVKWNPKQIAAFELLRSDAKHLCLRGGARSGKTFWVCHHLIKIALKHPGSRQAIFRYTLANVRQHVIGQTFKNLEALAFPFLSEISRLDKLDWVLRFDNGSQPGKFNGSEIWFGGLAVVDDATKRNADKVLGSEYLSIYLNETSEIPWMSASKAITRLAQKIEGARNRVFYDLNPTDKGHWTHKIFIEGRHPLSYDQKLPPGQYGSVKINPVDNAENLPDDYINELKNMDELSRMRFYYGEYANIEDGALWTTELLIQQRLISSQPPQLQRIIIAVDPSGSRGTDDLKRNEVGIIIMGLGIDGRGYVLEDLSGRFMPEAWSEIIGQAYERHKADCVVAESNFGGDMVRMVVQTYNANIPYREVTASRGKTLRAEPISALYHRGKIFHVGHFKKLEEQLCLFKGAMESQSKQFSGEGSPDRADALIFAATELFPSVVRRHEEINRLPTANKPSRLASRIDRPHHSIGATTRRPPLRR